jgi:regulator of RNase E activity RraA
MSKIDALASAGFVEVYTDKNGVVVVEDDHIRELYPNKEAAEKDSARWIEYLGLSEEPSD